MVSIVDGDEKTDDRENDYTLANRPRFSLELDSPNTIMAMNRRDIRTSSMAARRTSEFVQQHTEQLHITRQQ